VNQSAPHAPIQQNTGGVNANRYPLFTHARKIQVKKSRLGKIHAHVKTIILRG